MVPPKSCCRRIPARMRLTRWFPSLVGKNMSFGSKLIPLCTILLVVLPIFAVCASALILFLV